MKLESELDTRAKVKAKVRVYVLEPRVRTGLLGLRQGGERLGPRREQVLDRVQAGARWKQCKSRARNKTSIGRKHNCRHIC